MAAVSIYSLEGLAGLGGRVLFGVAADRLGVKPVLIVGLLIQSFAISGYLLASQLNEFYLLSIVFGGAYGGIMPLYAVLARDYFDQRNHGRDSRCGGDAVEPRHGDRAGRGWLGVRYVSRLSVALHRVGGPRSAAVVIAFAFPAARGANRELSVAG